MYRNNPVISNSSNSPQTSQPYYSRILLPKVSGNGPINHSQRRHSLLNGSSSTSSDRSKQSLVSAYFGRSRTLSRDSPSYMPTIFNFQPLNGYHSPVLKRRVCRTESTKTNLFGTPEPPNSDIAIKHGLRVFESKKRARELTDITVTTEESSQDGSDFGNSKRRKTSRTFDISTVGCTHDVDGFSFTSLRQLYSGNAVGVTVCATDNRLPSNVSDRNSRSVQTQVFNECEDDRTVSTTSSTGSVRASSNNISGSAAALRRKIPYMSPSELEAHLLSTKALAYTSHYALENHTSGAGDFNSIDLDTSPFQYSRNKVTARRIATESNQTVNDSTQSSLNNIKPPLVTNITCYDEKSETDSSELPVVQPTSLNRFIANLEGHSNLFLDKMSQSQIKTASGGFDVESRVKRIRELISAKSSNHSSNSSCGYSTHSAISSITSTSYCSPVSQILATSNSSPIVSTISSSLPSVHSTSGVSFMSVIVCNTSASFQNITSISNPSASSTTSKHFSFPVISSVSEVISTQAVIPTSIAVTSIVSLPGSISFGFTSTSNTSSPSISVTNASTVLATAVTSVSFSFSTASTAHVSILKEPTITSTIAVTTSASVSLPILPSVTNFSSVSTSESNSAVVPSSIFTFPTSTITTSATIISVSATTTATQKTTPAFFFSFPPTSSAPLSLQTNSSNAPSTANLTSSVFESLKPISTFSGFSFPKPAITSSASAPTSNPSSVAKNTVQSDSSTPFTFGSSNSQPISTASIFTFGASAVTTSSLTSVSLVSFGSTSMPSFLGSVPNSGTVSSSFVFGANLSKPSSTISSGAFGQTTGTTSSLNTVVNNAGLFTFTSPIASISGVSLFGSNPVNISSKTVSLPTNTSLSGFSSTTINPLLNPVSTTFSTNSFTLGIKPANVTPAKTTSLFGTSNSIFETPNTSSSLKFNFNQLTSSTASNVATSGLSFSTTIVTTTATSVTPVSTLFQFGSFSSNSKPSATSVSQPLSFGSSVPQFSFGQNFTSACSQPSTLPTLSFSSLNSGPITTTTNSFQFSSTPVFSNINPPTNFSGFNFSLPQTSTPSVITPQTNACFVFGQTPLSTGVANSNPFTFGTSLTSPSSNAPNAPRRRPLSSRRSRRP
ncbi:unnamed protein product [Schistosoma rodhaini]|nr:unnamed protein product [Schistosoma rodhaini]